MSALEWDTRTAYVLTEFVIFAIGAVVLLAVATSIAVVICYFYRHRNSRNESDKLKAVLSLHRSILRAVFADTIKLENQNKRGLVALWFLAVFSNSLFYRKTSTCNDLNVRDTDYSCFQISTRNVPTEVQSIIDEEGGELVPCRRVQNYITQNNVTFDLEVLCYLSQLNPMAALGVAYGATKSVVLVLEVVFYIGLAVARKGKRAKQFLSVAQALTVILVILGILIVPASLHEVNGPRNSAFDFLRGERFFSFAVIVLCGITVIIPVGLHPWWALDLNSNAGEPLVNEDFEEAKKLEMKDLKSAHIGTHPN